MPGAWPVHASPRWSSTWLGEAWAFLWPSTVPLEPGIGSPRPPHPSPSEGDPATDPISDHLTEARAFSLLTSVRSPCLCRAL